MAFRSIKVLADEVLRKAETVRAARNETVAENLNGRPPSASDSLPMLPVVDSNECGPTQPGGSERVGPTRDAHAQAARGSNEKKARSPGEVAGPSTGQRASGDVARLSDRSGIAPELKLIVCNDGRGHPHAAKRVPARSPRVSLIVIGGTDHTAPRSMTL